MSAGLALLQNFTPREATTDPLTSVPSGAGERMEAAWSAAQAPDRYWNKQTAQHGKAQTIIDDYYGLTGERLRNPFDGVPTSEELRENPGQATTAIYAKRLEILREKTTAARERVGDVGVGPDYLNVDRIDLSIGADSNALRARDEGLVGTGNGIPAFLAGSAGEMASPHGIASMFLPVSRLPTAAAEGIGAAWIRNIGKEALLQAALQAGVQIPASAIDYLSRASTGSQPTAGEVAHDVLSAGVGGALFGGAFRAAHLGIRKMVGHEAIDVPPAVKDAALVVESRDLYGDKNALGVPAAAHEAAIDRAVQDVAMGRAAHVPETVTQGIPTIHEAVREAQPELMARYDKLEETVRATREALENYPVEAERALAALRAEMIAEPRTGSQVADYQERIRQGEAEVKAAQEFAAGTGPESLGQQSLRSQMQVFDADMRDMLPKIREAYAAMDKVPEPVQRLQKMMDEPLPDTQPASKPYVPPEEPTAGRPETGSPQDKTMDAQVKQILEEGGDIIGSHRAEYEAILREEKEARVAAGCVGGGGL